MAEDLLERTLNAAGNRIAQVGSPQQRGDATLVDLESRPQPPAAVGAPGQSLLAAAADHVHPLPLIARVAASGTTVIPGRSTVALADFERNAGEVLLPNGLVWVDDDLPISWSGGFDVPIGPTAALIATWHERNRRTNSVSFMASNRSPDPVRISWASVGYIVAPAP